MMRNPHEGEVMKRAVSISHVRATLLLEVKMGGRFSFINFIIISVFTYSSGLAN
jgi:hypothetical protein